MTKRTRPKKRTEPKPDKQIVTKKEEAEHEPPYSSGNDYGGMPDRDLKKNLGGCG